MENPHTYCLFITYVENEGPFLKVWGQRDKHVATYIEHSLENFAPRFDEGRCKLRPEAVQVGVLCCAKYKDNKYYRAKITDVKYLNARYIEVSFIDYGNKDMVPGANLRSFEDFDSSFISIPAQASNFLLAEAVCSNGEWCETILEEISKEIRYLAVNFIVVAHATKHYLIRFFVNGSNLGLHLINRGLMQPTSIATQEAVLLSIMPRTPVATIADQNIATYKAYTLEPGSEYQVYVSYITDGPCNFSVQLKQSEGVLGILMKEINSMSLTPIDYIPIPGAVCFARCLEDGNVCRAVVTNEVDGQFKVYYVDFGNFEVVPLEALYEIPFKYIIPKVMALRFALASIEKSAVTLEMQCAFKKFVDNRLVQIKVMPTGPRTALPRCELWDPETNINALDVVKQAATNLYPEPITLNRGMNLPIRVSYVFSCNRFYVQIKSKEDELKVLMEQIQIACTVSKDLELNNLKVGLPCYALFEIDQQWYRCKVLEILDNDKVKVHYVDYGNEDIMSPSALKPIEGAQLTALRPQAIECCLNGYQNMDIDINRDNLLEELILDNEFTMKVIEMQNNKALVEMINSEGYNIASLLLNKIAECTKSLISPILVQEGNRLEHRKTSHQKSYKEQSSNEERKFVRNENNQNDRMNENTTWRQNNKGFRHQNSTELTSPNESGSDTTWKQNDRGFNRNYEKNKRNDNRSNDWKDRDSNRSNDWKDRDSNRSNDFKNNSFKKNKDRFNDSLSSINSDTYKPRGFKKKPDYKREGSEISSSSSESSYQKRNKNKPRFNKKSDSYGSDNHSMNVNNISLSEVPNAASNIATFETLNMDGAESTIIVSWFHNPGCFYVQLQETQDTFKQMMEEIQESYKSYKPSNAIIGSPIIALFPEDGVLYRARVIEVIGKQYKVHYIDFGNVSLTEKVWPVEMKFMTLPAQAICCSLNAIEPTSDCWSDASFYSHYFDKNNFLCKFITHRDERNIVELCYQNVSVGDQLIKDDLAKSVEAYMPSIEIPLLLGQQFRALLKSVNNINDFTVSLQCDILLMCTLANPDALVENAESYLKESLEKVLILYVNNIIDDILQVTLYDLDGVKLPITDNDEEEYNIVEPLCPSLILSSTLTGCVSYVDGQTIFIQPTEYADSVAYLLDQMYEYYEQINLETPIIPEEGSLYAVKSSDGNWYRSRVTSFNDEMATVSYLDYGNTENVEFIALRQLAPEHMEINILCVEVLMNESTENLLDQEITVTLKFGETTWEGSILQSVEGAENNVPSDETAVNVESNYFVEKEETLSTLPNDQENVISPLADEHENVIFTPANEPSYPTPISQQEISNYVGTSIVLSHFDSPSDFYIQLSEAIDSIDQLQLTLQEQVTEMPNLENPTVGVFCAAPYSLDQQWYRAQVLDADSDITTVRFIDYGNTDVLDNETTHVKTLPPNLLSLEVYATRCRLKIKPIDEEWNTAASERFEQLTNSGQLTAEFIDQDEKTNYIELYCNGDNVKQFLIDEKLAAPDELVSESNSIGFVSHLNSPSEFWIQLENCIDELEWIAEQLSAAENFLELEDLAPGTLCAAMFPDDEMWYRARILSNTVAGVEVLFVDYGNSCLSCSLRQLPEDLIMLPPLAQKCSLQKPPGLTSWLPGMVKKFTEISAEGQTTFTVHKLSTGETALVELFLNGEDLSLKLLPVTEDGYVKNVEGFHNFNVEINGEQSEPKYKLETLEGVTWDEESYKKFIDITDEGKTLFQIEFVSEDIVRLYRDGNDIRLDLGGIVTDNSSTSLNTENVKNIHIESNLEIETENIKETNIDSSLTNENDSNLHSTQEIEITNTDVIPENEAISDVNAVQECIEDAVSPQKVNSDKEVLNSQSNEKIDDITDVRESLETNSSLINDTVSPEKTSSDQTVEDVASTCADDGSEDDKVLKSSEMVVGINSEKKILNLESHIDNINDSNQSLKTSSSLINDSVSPKKTSSDQTVADVVSTCADEEPEVDKIVKLNEITVGESISNTDNEPNEEHEGVTVETSIKETGNIGGSEIAADQHEKSEIQQSVVKTVDENAVAVVKADKEIDESVDELLPEESNRIEDISLSQSPKTVDSVGDNKQEVDGSVEGSVSPGKDDNDAQDAVDNVAVMETVVKSDPSSPEKAGCEGEDILSSSDEMKNVVKTITSNDAIKDEEILVLTVPREMDDSNNVQNIDTAASDIVNDLVVRNVEVISEKEVELIVSSDFENSITVVKSVVADIVKNVTCDNDIVATPKKESHCSDVAEQIIDKAEDVIHTEEACRKHK